MHNLPFAQPGQFYRGNLHTHCTESDGDYPVEEVVRRYREKGYDFLALSDHFLECYDYPVTDTRSFRSDNFTTLIAHAVEVYNHGPQIENITIEGDVVSVECSPASTVIISGRGSRSDKVFGTKLRSARLPLGRFVQGHFRITVVDAQGRKAWSNPVWLS